MQAHKNMLVFDVCFDRPLESVSSESPTDIFIFVVNFGPRFISVWFITFCGSPMSGCRPARTNYDCSVGWLRSYVKVAIRWTESTEILCRSFPPLIWLALYLETKEQLLQLGASSHTLFACYFLHPLDRHLMDRLWGTFTAWHYSTVFHRPSALWTKFFWQNASFLPFR